VTPVAQYVALGVCVGALGTLVGAGGGFILLPVLAILDPSASPASLTAISLAIVCANATSGSVAYARMGRVDWRSGLLFAAAGLPGSVLGAWATQFLNRRVFDPLLGAILIIGAAGIALVPAREQAAPQSGATRTIVARDGTTYAYSPRIGRGIAFSVVVGFVSSVLGIGGGILHVPAMVYWLGIPTHVATATSHLVLAILALAGVLVHLRDGTLVPALGTILPLVAGVLVGAPVGAWLSSRVKGHWILRGLALALASVGLRLVLVR
jgi:uncharacterized membrane protein YfcA